MPTDPNLRIALGLAPQLPEEKEDAREVLRHLAAIVETFFENGEEMPDQRPAVLALRGERGPNPSRRAKS
jgi:hypothetical protein